MREKKRRERRGGKEKEKGRKERGGRLDALGNVIEGEEEVKEGAMNMFIWCIYVRGVAARITDPPPSLTPSSLWGSVIPAHLRPTPAGL